MYIYIHVSSSPNTFDGTSQQTLFRVFIGIDFRCHLCRRHDRFGSTVAKTQQGNIRRCPCHIHQGFTRRTLDTCMPCRQFSRLVRRLAIRMAVQTIVQKISFLKESVGTPSQSPKGVVDTRSIHHESHSLYRMVYSPSSCRGNAVYTFFS